MMKSFVVVLGTLAIASANPTPRQGSTRRDAEYLTDIDVISKYWGQISPYRDNKDNVFGVTQTGLPSGCQIEQVHTLQRHASRFPTSYVDDGVNDERFAEKLENFTAKAYANASFTGPLAFLNSYTYTMGEGYLTGIGAGIEFESGLSFWNRYGRTLYNASVAQLAYNASFANGTARPKPVLRTTGQSRIENSQINWALGFFGPSFEITANPELLNATSAFDVVIIPEGGTENNTLASYDSCFNDYDEVIGYLGDTDLFSYIPIYLADATARLQRYAPEGFTLTTNDTYAMQSICAYETGYLGMSDFCEFFTEDEWAGFENTLDIEYYYDYGYGNPTGRAQGIGYVQELLARITNQYITSSNSSVNSTLDDNEETFPLHQPFYADFSHDDIIISALAAMSVDYYRDPPSLSEYPPNPERHFNLNKLTPFGARLITEIIGCASEDPKPVSKPRTQYTPTQYGYDPANAPHKFVRMRLNNGIVPLNSIRGGACGNSTTGRPDGLCDLDSFVQSQANSYELSNYDFVCFGNYTLDDPHSGQDYDGTISE